jgi:alcohol dehydrogenase (cytochrome c)
MPYCGGDATVAISQVNGGLVTAFDPASGREVWSWKARHPIVASLLATAGDLIFVGEPMGGALASRSHLVV